MGRQYSSNQLYIGGYQLEELQQWADPEESRGMEIDCLYIGDGFTIFKNNENEYFGCGSNWKGQCAVGKFCDKIHELTMINYFTNHNIKIKNIFLNVMNYSLFWMNKNGEIYTNGN
eukprot:187743_1